MLSFDENDVSSAFFGSYAPKLQQLQRLSALEPREPPCGKLCQPWLANVTQVTLTAKRITTT
jgi:hypothetical protein